MKSNIHFLQLYEDNYLNLGFIRLPILCPERVSNKSK